MHEPECDGRHGPRKRCNAALMPGLAGATDARRAREAGRDLGTVSAPRRPPVSSARLRLAVLLEASPLIAAATGAAIWTIPRPSAHTNLTLLLFTVYVLPLGLFSTGTGWVAVRRHGLGIAVFVVRGAAVVTMLLLGVVASLAPQLTASVVLFLVFLGICLASSAASAIALAWTEVCVRRIAPPLAAGEAAQSAVAARIASVDITVTRVASSAAGRRQAVLILVAIVGGATLLSFVLFASSHGPAAPPPRDTDISMNAVRNFSGFPVYWVGPAYGAEPLDRIIGQYPGDDRDPILVLYGFCGKAFETGCAPALVVKTQAGCLGNVDPNLKVRERTAHQGSHLSVQAGEVVVTLYAATPQLEANAARDMFMANPDASPNIPRVTPGAALPGSLCELARLHPRAVPAVGTQGPVTTRESLPATVISAFGRLQSLHSLKEAEEQLGWRVLRTNDPRFTLSLVGALRTFRNTLPRLEQTKYTMVGHDYPIEIAQEPESYRTFDVAPYSSIATIGPWTGLLWTYRAQLGFEFYSGEMVDGQRVRVSVYAERGAVTLDDIRTFVRTLGFGK